MPDCLATPGSLAAGAGMAGGRTPVSRRSGCRAGAAVRTLWAGGGGPSVVAPDQRFFDSFRSHRFRRQLFLDRSEGRRILVMLRLAVRFCG